MPGGNAPACHPATNPAISQVSGSARVCRCAHVCHVEPPSWHDLGTMDDGLFEEFLAVRGRLLAGVRLLLCTRSFGRDGHVLCVGSGGLGVLRGHSKHCSGAGASHSPASHGRISLARHRRIRRRSGGYLQWQPAVSIPVLWNGTTAYTPLAPAGVQGGVLGMHGEYQVGYTGPRSGARAALWSGSVQSHVNLHPAGFAVSVASAVWGSQQGGEVWEQPNTRWAIRIAVCVLLGMAINVAVAWAVIFPPVWKNMKVHSWKATEPWPVPVPRPWPPPDRVMVKSSFGYGVPFWTRYHFRSSGSTHYRVDVHDAGWPLMCMRRTEWMHFDVSAPTSGAGGASVVHHTDGLPARTWWTWGAPIPRGLLPPGVDWKRLPLRPLPAPFAANTAAYSGAVLLLWIPPLVVRRWTRRRRSRCLVCGYSLLGIGDGAPCPECGAVGGRRQTAPA
jgi:hypothetical protein